MKMYILTGIIEGTNHDSYLIQLDESFTTRKNNKVPTTV